MRCGAALGDRLDYTGAIGAVYGVRLLEALRRLGGVESHLLISSAGWLDNLITRAADVTLKARRLAHLRDKTAVTEMGGAIFPMFPAFYNQPASIGELVDHRRPHAGSVRAWA